MRELRGTTERTMNNEPYCAVCQRHVAPDDDHIIVAAQHVRVSDRDEQDDYYLHPKCWRSVSEGWMKPA